MRTYLNDENARKTIESGLDRLIISLDGTSQEVYSQYRIGGDLEKVLAGAANIVKWKKKLNSKTPYIFFQFLVVRPNEHQMEEAKALAVRTGVDGIRFKTAQIYDYEKDPNKLIPQHSNISRYRKKADGEYESKNRMQNHCWRLWHAPVITWDGLVVPCCFDKDAKHRMGDLKNKPFKEIWKTTGIHRFSQEDSERAGEKSIYVPIAAKELKYGAIDRSRGRNFRRISNFMTLEKDINQQVFRSEYQKAIINLIYTFNWVNEKINRRFEPFDITQQQFNILRILRGAGQPLSTLQIRQRMLDKMSDTSRIVDRLVKKGMVKKSICREDRRLVDVLLTDKGKKLLQTMDVIE